MLRPLLLATLLDLASVAGAPQAQAPAFSSYPAGRIYTGVKVAPRLRPGTAAWRYRTVIREGYKNNPVNFAGNYVVLSWGCGSPCQAYAIVDARTGKVFFSEFQTSFGAAFHPDSRLFVANLPLSSNDSCDSVPEWACAERSTDYYRWNGQRLTLVATVPGHQTPPPADTTPSR
jgi:hypothetical protein